LIAKGEDISAHRHPGRGPQAGRRGRADGDDAAGHGREAAEADLTRFIEDEAGDFPAILAVWEALGTRGKLPGSRDTFAWGMLPLLICAELGLDFLRALPLEVTFSCKHFLEGRRLPKEVEDALYRAARQALDNVRRHAEASLVRVELRMEGGHAVMIVRDDGHGFDSLPSSAARLRLGHLGLITVRERMEALGGEFDIQSGRGQGSEFRVKISIPTPTADGLQLVVAGISE